MMRAHSPFRFLPFPFGYVSTVHEVSGLLLGVRSNVFVLDPRLEFLQDGGAHRLLVGAQLALGKQVVVLLDDLRLHLLRGDLVREHHNIVRFKGVAHILWDQYPLHVVGHVQSSDLVAHLVRVRLSVGIYADVLFFVLKVDLEG